MNSSEITEDLMTKVMDIVEFQMINIVFPGWVGHTVLLPVMFDKCGFSKPAGPFLLNTEKSLTAKWPEWICINSWFDAFSVGANKASTPRSCQRHSCSPSSERSQPSWSSGCSCRSRSWDCSRQIYTRSSRYSGCRRLGKRPTAAAAAAVLLHSQLGTRPASGGINLCGDVVECSVQRCWRWWCFSCSAPQSSGESLASKISIRPKYRLCVMLADGTDDALFNGTDLSHSLVSLWLASRTLGGQGQEGNMCHVFTAGKQTTTLNFGLFIHQNASPKFSDYLTTFSR